MSAHPVAFGLWGKLPSRGDFVRLGLPRGFTDAWDLWLSSVLVQSQALLGEAWRPAWMAAPVWRFCLQPGLCGPDAVLGLWMPSVDSAGRAYPLTLAACVPPGFGLGPAAEAWLDAAEDAGLAALERRLQPDAVVAGLPQLDAASGPAPDGASVWWAARPADPAEDGLPPRTLVLPALPDGEEFSRMLS